MGHTLLTRHPQARWSSNQVKPEQREIPVAYLRECFDLDEMTGELTWRARPGGHFTAPHRAKNSNRWVGKKAGRLNMNGYFVVTLTHEGHIYKALVHRIIWALVHGAWPKQFIDHINRNKLDNRIANLRDVSHSENMRNSSRTLARSPHIAVGVYATRSGRYRSQVHSRGVIHYLGTFDRAEDASAAFQARRAALTTAS